MWARWVRKSQALNFFHHPQLSHNPGIHAAPLNLTKGKL